MTAGHHRPGGSGDSRPASARRARRASARKGAASADAQAGTVARPFPAEALALVVVPAATHALLFGASRLLLSILARAEARRWRAEGAPLKP